MEFPDLGKHCSVSSCNKLDFLPIKCDACGQIFCEEHYQYAVHNCSNAYKKNNQVPVCPLCNIPIPVPRGQAPDIAVGEHIDNDCQSDPAKNNRKVFTNKCSLKGCKTKEVIPITCNECTLNFCLKHRHPADHSCEGKLAAVRKKNLQAVLSRQKQSGASSQANGFVSQVQGNMSDDEALARALALSMQETSMNTNKLTQEELDLALARQLQASETETAVGGTRNQRDRCNVS
ncbi:hypothetical protein ILUMI_10110 [Ignelater luminosus]|uniref:AN1-type domain-containing protein n=1 Tax=Ignelater luminosus TaxID=2038154 RepID=A0A8K0D2P0_IGNLU|nr:hypothetical protein ILUMI_10110 [Ignelater luminosus]